MATNMMKPADVKRHLATFESQAKLAALRRHRISWECACDKAWTLDFVLRATAAPGYQAPQQRIPFPPEAA